jgi:hypothetical protein
MAKSKVNIRPLKDFALREIPRVNLCRQLLLAERDWLETSEFESKINVLLKLLRQNRI